MVRLAKMVGKEVVAEGITGYSGRRSNRVETEPWEWWEPHIRCLPQSI